MPLRAGLAGAMPPAYIAAQVSGAFIGVAAAHLMFGQALLQVSHHAGLYITGAYWFTASTSFANPAVTLAREYGTWGGEIRPGFEPKPGDIVATEHWCSSGFANTDLDLQLKKHGVILFIAILSSRGSPSDETLKTGASVLLQNMRDIQVKDSGALLMQKRRNLFFWGKTTSIIS
jgi:hypothetical protein